MFFFCQIAYYGKSVGKVLGEISAREIGNIAPIDLLHWRRYALEGFYGAQLAAREAASVLS